MPPKVFLSYSREVLRRGIAWESGERPASVAELCRELSRPAAVSVPSRLREPEPGEERVNKQDASVLSYVPGNKYSLGTEPVHRVILSPFWLGKYPVTNEQYSRFLLDNPQALKPGYWDDKRFNAPNQPVVGVSWQEAQDYCRWAGLELPSEAQWEAAARGTDRRRFPWGDTEPTPKHANFDNREKWTTPVGIYPKGAGPFGTLDQAGNVWEWCLDTWDMAAYRERNGKHNPVSTTGDPAARCLRGGSWYSPAWDLAAAYRRRNGASERRTLIGFRCSLPARPSLEGTAGERAVEGSASLEI